MQIDKADIDRLNSLNERIERSKKAKIGYNAKDRCYGKDFDIEECGPNNTNHLPPCPQWVECQAECAR